LKRDLKGVIPIATDSFLKDFAITRRETVEKLENDIKHIKALPVYVDSHNVIAELKRNEGRLLNMLRSKRL